jgi:hypothetical protein
LVKARLKELKSDERYNYKPADVFVNAPLALIQVDIEARVSALEWVLKEIDGDDKIKKKEKRAWLTSCGLRRETRSSRS